MAHGLRYFKEIKQKDGWIVRLEILQRDYAGSPVEIGAVVQGLSLQMQGQQGGIDTPIVKTSLSMTFIDAPDIQDGRKNGDWEEFYTADATEWQVLLKRGSQYVGTFTTVWGGYITPDSFSEDLVYRGSVNIIARDNIGHMQDFIMPADVGFNDGTATIQDLVAYCWAKIESPMTLDWLGDGEGVNWMYCDGVPLYLARVNSSFFEGMNCYEAVEKVLSSIGCVMRYVGRNRIHICPIRDMSKHGYFDYAYFATLPPVFVAGARRELSPAAKMIEEVAKYDLVEDIQQPQITADDFIGVQGTYKCKIEGGNDTGTNWGQEEHDAPVWRISPRAFEEGWHEGDSPLFFDLSQYETGYFTKRARNDEEMRKYMYLAANNTDAREVRYEKRISLSDFSIRMKFGLPIALNSAKQLEVQTGFNLKSISYSIAIEQDGVLYYYAGGSDWTTTKTKRTKTYTPSDNVTEWIEQVYIGDNLIQNMTGNEGLVLSIYKIEYAQMTYASTQKTGLYACVQELSIGIPETASLREKNTIKTIYNEGNNIVITRDPDLAPAYDNVLLSGCIKNGIFIAKDYAKKPAKDWYFEGGDPAQLGVHIHKMLLCYHSKPNNVITGTLINADFDSFSCNWLWREKEHILTSGTLNLLTQQMEGATLREFIRYEDMWNNEGGEAGGTPEIKPENPPIIV